MGFNHPYEIAWFYEKLYTSIGMRYHSTIFSIAGKTPNVNIYTNEYQKLKMEALPQIPELINGKDIQSLSLLKKKLSAILQRYEGYAGFRNAKGTIWLDAFQLGL